MAILGVAMGINIPYLFENLSYWWSVPIGLIGTALLIPFWIEIDKAKKKNEPS